MVDQNRAYRRWRLRRLARLLPVFLAAVATQTFFAVTGGTPPWLRVVALGAAALVLTLVGYLLALTVLCSRLHSRGDRAAARALREQLEYSRRAAPAAAFLLLLLNLVPRLMPEPSEAPRIARSPRQHVRAFPVRPDSTPLEEAELVVPEPAPAPAPPAPNLQPPIETLPLHLAIEEFDPIPLPPAATPVAVSVQDGDRDFPRFRPGAEDEVPWADSGSLVLTLVRRGVPDERDQETWLPPELRMDVSLLRAEGRATEVSLILDVPFSRDESIRTEIHLGTMIEGEGFLPESGEAAWQRVTVSYERRLIGYTRHAPFDLAVSIGATADRFVPAGIEVNAPATSLSPAIGIDAAVWQTGGTGLLVHAGYSIPLDATGSSSGILDVSAIVTIDLTDGVSVHAGYRYVRVRRSGEEVVAGPGRSEDFAGPVFGLYVRF